ncbi:MAG: peptidylprolyl isomerase [Planctomycetaceae bacterium]|nr:peptidylprolyl isomerase [Planctomycetaceae bacterium]
MDGMQKIVYLLIAALGVCVAAYLLIFNTDQDPERPDPSAPFFGALFDEKGNFHEPMTIAYSHWTLKNEKGRWYFSDMPSVQVDMDWVNAYLDRIKALKFGQAEFLGAGQSFHLGVAREVNLMSSDGKRFRYWVTDGDTINIDGDENTNVYRVKGLQPPLADWKLFSRSLKLITEEERNGVTAVEIGDYAKVVRNKDRKWAFEKGAEGLAHQGRVDWIVNLFTNLEVSVLGNAKPHPSKEVKNWQCVVVTLKDGARRAVQIESPIPNTEAVKIKTNWDMDVTYTIKRGFARKMLPSIDELKGLGPAGIGLPESPRPDNQQAQIRVIVIGYKGLEWPKTSAASNRSKEQARLLAEETLMALRSPGGEAEFDRIAREISDYVDSKESPDLVTVFGPYPRGDKWYPEVEAVAFSLVPGAWCTDPIDSRYGFYIVQRLR